MKTCSLPRRRSAFALTGLLVLLGCSSGGRSQAQLTVGAGLGSGAYAPGTVVTIVADEAPANREFDRWTGDTAGVDSVTEPTTTIVMPGFDIRLDASFRDLVAPQFLTVNGGTGSGTYAAGTDVAITADPAPAGQVFDRWTGDTAGLASGSTPATTLTMPASDVEITSVYRVVPPPSAVVKWTRQVVSLVSSSFTGNPFEVEVDATFTHTDGTKITLPGYYSGSDTWEIGFMPTRVGTWNYVTASADPDLNGKTGTFTENETGGRGMLKGDPGHPKKWRFQDGTWAIPITLRTQALLSTASEADFIKAANFMRDNNLHMMETAPTDGFLLHNGVRYFKGDWRDHEFDLVVWNRFQRRLDILAERGLGMHLILYSDDEMAPQWAGKSDTEKLFIRYVIARLAAYPMVVFNTGIDIVEYRSESEVNWIGQQFKTLDPYGHPVSSRRGGGSGTIVMQDETFASHGDPQARISGMLDHFADANNIPVSMDDAWGELRGTRLWKDHTPPDIRRAFWKCVAAGGLGGMIRGTGDGLDADGIFAITHMETDLESEQWLKLVNPFVNDKLGDVFGVMVPTPSLVDNGFCLADPARTKLLFLLIGENDTYEASDGGDVTVRLSSVSKNYEAIWYDTRTGTEASAGTLNGGSNHVLTPPSTDDWVLLLTES